MATPLTTTGVGTAVQDTVSVKPAGGTVSLVAADGTDVTFLATDAGYYYADPFGGYLEFSAHDGFAGTAPTVTYRITNAALESSTSTYTATVTKPAGPIAVPLTSTRTGGPYYQGADTSGIAGNPAAYLLSGTVQVESLKVAGKGTYYAQSGDGISLSFQADKCFVGTVPAVTYRLVDLYAQHSESTYTAHVTNPDPPTASPLTSTGVGTVTQTVTAPQPNCAGSTKLLNGSGLPVTKLTRADGTYTADPATGVITFVPAPGYAGTGSAVTYRVTDQYGQHADSSYTTSVTAPPAPTASALTSTGVGPAAQHVTAAVPIGGRAALLAGVNPVTSLTIAGQGTYVVSATSGDITFTPEADYLGTATSVRYRVTDSYGQSATSTYSATVTKPAVPNPPALTSTGVGTAAQSRTVSIPPAGTVTLLDGLTPVTTLTIAGQGNYALDPATGVISFNPVNGFVGTATSAQFTVTDSYGQTGSSTYTAAVTTPAPPTAAPLKSSGAEGATQRQTVAIPPGGAVTLLDGTVEVTMVTNAGQGTYALDPDTGVITFTPIAGYSGSPTPVTYQLSDAYGQFARSIYAPLVTAPGPTTTPTSPTTTTSPAPTTTSPAPIATTSAPTAISTASSTTNTAPTTTDTASTSTSTMPFAAAAATSTPPMAGSLAYTGSSATKLVRTALLLVLLGGALNAAAHYRRRPRSDQPPRGHRRH